MGPACRPLLCCILSAFSLRLPLLLIRGRWSPSCRCKAPLLCERGVAVCMSGAIAWPGARSVRNARQQTSSQPATCRYSNSGVRPAARSCTAVANCWPSAGVWPRCTQLHPTGLHQPALTLSHHTPVLICCISSWGALPLDRSTVPITALASQLLALRLHLPTPHLSPVIPPYRNPVYPAVKRHIHPDIIAHQTLHTKENNIILYNAICLLLVM